MGIYNPSASGSSSGRLAIRSVTAATTATTADNIIQASGGAFTVTLPAASTSLGLELIIKKTDLSFTNIITVAAAGTDTIDSAATTTLNTQGEQVTLVSDGVSNWALVSRTYPQTFTSYTPTFVGLGTVTQISVTYQRVGNMLNIRGFFSSGTSTAVTASMTLPSGLTTAAITNPPWVAGYGWIAANDASAVYNGLLNASTTLITFGRQASNSSWSTALNGTAFLGSGQNYSFFYNIPIAGWN